MGNTVSSETLALHRFASKQLLVPEIMAKFFFFEDINKYQLSCISLFLYFMPLSSNLMAVTVRLNETTGLGGRNTFKLLLAIELNSSV